MLITKQGNAELYSIIFKDNNHDFDNVDDKDLDDLIFIDAELTISEK